MEFLRRLNGGQLLFLLLSSLATFTVALSFVLTNNLATQVIVAILVSIILVLSARQFIPPVAYRMRTFRYAIWVYAGLFLAAASFRSFLDGYLFGLVQDVWPEFVLSAPLDSAPTAAVLVLVVLMYTVTLFCLREGGSVIPTPTDPLMKTASYCDLRQTFVRNLELDLGRVDEELNWNHADFISLDAEVDVRNVGARRTRTVDLVTALKNNQEADIFVVIGVPGAGKSVALRKCCRDLLETQTANERIPIYVNLKEWAASDHWSTASGPTDEEFAKFIRRNIKNRLPNNMLGFFEDHFDRMLSAGELFFVFDSFDEIPGILDVDETSQLLKLTSNVLVRYLQGSANGRGIIASRYYRRPRIPRTAYVQLDVRPFSDRQIANVIKTGPRPEELLRLLYEERLELGALARNPFSLSLLMDYWRNNGWTVPQNQSELYRSYIDQNLKAASEQITDIGLSIPDIRQAMEDISWEMFGSTGRGLEMSVRELRAALDNPNIDEIIDILIAARLARKASRTQAVSFVHRRFNEYFIVSRWLSGAAEAPLEAIPNDERSRDALVLYAEVVDKGEARRIAEFCWAEISDGLQDKQKSGVIQLRVVYCLRFLVEAFRTRQDTLNSFQAAFSELIIETTRLSDDIMLRKIAVEAVGLLPPNAAEETLVRALEVGNWWIVETAISSCRYLPRLPQSVTDGLYRSLSTTGLVRAVRPDPEMMFALSLSEVFHDLRARIRARQIDWGVAFLAGLLLVGLLSLDVRPIGLQMAGSGILIVAATLGLFMLIKYQYFKGFDQLSRLGRASPISHFVFTRKIQTLLSDSIILGIILSPSFTILIICIKLIENNTENEIFNSNLIENNNIIHIKLIYIIFILIFMQFRIGTIKRLGPAKSARDLAAYLSSLLKNIFYLKFYYILIVPFLLFGFLGLLVNQFPILMFWFSRITLFGLGSAALVLGMAIAGKMVSAYRYDTKAFSSATAMFIPKRAQIADDFKRIRSDHYRLRYARWLEKEANDPEHLIALSKDNWDNNSWPNGRRPNIGNDNSSTLLAQLDGRWLGLEI